MIGKILCMLAWLILLSAAVSWATGTFIKRASKRNDHHDWWT